MQLPPVDQGGLGNSQEQRAEEIRVVARSASFRRDSLTLNKARQYASDLGFSTEAQEAERLLNQTEAQRMLAAAIQKRHPGLLRAAISRAKMCNLESRDLESAARLLAHDEATVQMKQAMMNKDADKLEAALKRAKAIGIEHASLEKAARSLTLLRARERSPRQPAGAMNEKTLLPHAAHRRMDRTRSTASNGKLPQLLNKSASATTGDFNLDPPRSPLSPSKWRQSAF